MSVNNLIESIQVVLNETLNTKYRCKDVFFRKKINAEDKKLDSLISEYTAYVQTNLENQKQLATKGGLNDRQYNQPLLSNIQSEKETVEFLMNSLKDNISSHHAELSSYSGQIIAFAALIVAIVSLILSLVIRKNF